MIENNKVVCVIPARVNSSRFPRKMFSLLREKPLLQWIWERASQIACFDEVVFAVDSEELGEWISRFSGRYFLTSTSCPSGTDRLIELHREKKVEADLWVNWQGDEPFISEQMVRQLLQTAATDGADIWTLKKKIVQLEELHTPHVAKVVCDSRGHALYFSRSVIPFVRDPSCAHAPFYKHIGLYAFSEKALQRMHTLPACELENAEKLEQLRFLYHGLSICVHETEAQAFGIDLPEHLAQAELLAGQLFYT